MEEYDISEEEVNKRMKREIKANNQFWNLSNFVTVYDYAVKDNLKYYILMEYVKGPRLDVLYDKKLKLAKTDEEREEVKKIVWKILK